MRKSSMLKFLSVLVLTSLVVGLFAPYGFAQGPIEKLGRGMLNVLFGWLEMPMNIRDTYREEDVGMAITYGAFKGVFRFVLRTLVGTYEIVTFPIPIPADYDPIMTDPEYFLGKEEVEEIE